MLTRLRMLFLFSCVSALSSANVAQLQQQLSQQYPNLQLSDIQATEMADLYSAKLDQQIIYLDGTAQYMFIGTMMRLKDQKNLTQALVLKQNAIDWTQLPLQDAIKIVKGNGQQQLAVFSDPNCPYCKKLESEFARLNDVTLYIFIYPLKTQSFAVAKQLWCAKNQAEAWKNLMQHGITPKAKICANPIERNLALGRQLKLQGTPTLIFANGLKILGVRSAEEIQAIWQTVELEKSKAPKP